MRGVELATAWVRLVPSLDGATDNIVKSLAPSGAGEDAGKKLGDGVKSGLTTKQAAIMGAIGGVFATVANQAIGAVTDLFSEAVSASDATDKFVQTLSFAKLDTSAIERAKNESRAYADQTVYDLTTIQNTTAQLAANGVKDYMGLTKAAGNLNAVSGGNAETFKSVAMVMSQTAGAGKLTTENWNQLADAIPGASGRLQEALAQAGAYTGNFRTAMEKGEITADEFNAAIMQLGTEPVAVEAATSVSTMEGAVGNLSASIVGKLSDAFSAIKPMLTPVISGFAEFISNAQVFTPVVAGLAAAVLFVLAPSIWAAVTATWAWTVALLANPMTWVVLAIAALVAAIVALAMNWDTVTKWISDVWGGFVDWLGVIIDGLATWWGDVWSGISSFFTAVWNGIVEFAKGVWQVYIGWLIDIISYLVQNWDSIWSAVGSFFTDMWNGIVTWATSVWDGFINWIIDLLTGYMAWWNGLWSGIGSFFTNLWQGIVNVATGIVQGYVSTLMAIFNGVAAWWNGLWSGIGGFFSGVWNGIIGAVGQISGAFQNAFAGIGGFVQNAFSGVVGIVRGPVNGIIGLVNSAIRGLNGLSVTIPSWVPLVGGQTWGLHIPSIPMLADGATVKPRPGGTLAVLAEAGKPESVVDTGLLNRALQEGIDGNGSRGGLNVQGPLVQVDRMVVDSDTRVEEVAQELYARAARASRANGNINLEGAVA